jgi:hypothetical protein
MKPRSVSSGRREGRAIVRGEAEADTYRISGVPPISWNYRIVKRRDGSFGLHEVFYDSAGEPWSMTANPARFECMADDDPAELAGALELALRDAREHPVFEEPEPGQWPGKAGGVRLRTAARPARWRRPRRNSGGAIPR